VLLLQQRLPVLLERRKTILATRRQLAAWGPWLAHLHSITGGLAAEASAQLLAHTSSAAGKPSACITGGAGDERGHTPRDAGAAAVTASPADAAAAAAAAVPTAGAAASAGPSAPGSVHSSRPVSPRKAGAESSRPQTAAQAAPPAQDSMRPGSALEEAAQLLALQVSVRLGLGACIV
jgi:hypothetical protein